MILVIIFAYALLASFVSWLVNVLVAHFTANAAAAAIVNGAVLLWAFWALLTYAPGVQR